MTQAELAALLRDCLLLWAVSAWVEAGEAALLVHQDGETCIITAGRAPVRWLLQTPTRKAQGRGPRGLPSVPALLTALRAALGAPAGIPARIGGGAGMIGSAP